MPVDAVGNAGPAADFSQIRRKEVKTKRGVSAEVVIKVRLRDAAMACRIPVRIE